MSTSEETIQYLPFQNVYPNPIDWRVIDPLNDALTSGLRATLSSINVYHKAFEFSVSKNIISTFVIGLMIIILTLQHLNIFCLIMLEKKKYLLVAIGDKRTS